MIACAALIDFMQFLLALIPFIGGFLGMFLSVISMFLFGIWFSHEDVSLMSSKRVMGFLSTIVGEAIPYVDAIPFWTGLVSFTVINEWRRPDEI